MVYLLALIGMVCWGVSPLFAKWGLKDIDPLAGLFIRTVFTAVVIFIWLCFNGHIGTINTIPVKSILLLITEAIMATVIGDLAYFAALKRGSASIVMLIMSCSPLVTIIASVFLLGEKLTVSNMIGAALIIIGIIILV